MILLDKLKRVLSIWQVRSLRRRMHSEPFVLPSALRNPRRVLVCLPDGLRELTLIKSFLPTISELFPAADITLLPMPGSIVTDIFPRKGFRIENTPASQLTWSGLPGKDLMKRLTGEKFDLLIDLNLTGSDFTSAVLLHFPSAIRIGRGNHLGAPFYNLEIKSTFLRDEKNIYRTLFDTIAQFTRPSLLNATPAAGR